MNNNDKLALRESTTAIKCKLIIKSTDTLPQIILTESNYIKDWTYTDDRYVPQKGFIGQFVARTLSGNLQNIDNNFNIENREVELQIGIVNRDKNTENWYSMGNFLITNPEDDEVRDNTKFEAMDYAKLFNKTFDGDYTDNIFTVSYNAKMENKETVNALWLAKYTCAQVNVELGSTAFTNSDYEIDINPFRNNEPCRDVMKEISKLAYSWVRIGWDNKCYIDFGVKQESSVDQYDIFTNDHYYTLETKKEAYGPVNKVVVGMSNVDGESHVIVDNPSITVNGEHAIYIYDNPLTYTFEHRERANKQGNVLFGLTYSHIKCETIGFPWLIGNELISISDMEGNKKYTYPFNKTITYSGHIKSTIETMGESSVEETLGYESDVIRNLRNTMFNVNKQEGIITLLSEHIENVEREINPTETASGIDVKVEDASDNPLIQLEIEGKSEQYKHVSQVPSDYIQLDYVESTYAQYIDTGVKPTANDHMVIETEIKWKSVTTGNRQLFGANNQAFYWGKHTSGYYELGTNNLGTTLASTDKFDVIKVTTDNKTKTTTINVNGVDEVSRTYNSGPSYNHYLFNIGSGGTIYNFYTQAKIKYYRIILNGETIQDLIPCMRKSDNLVGLYDIINDVFYVSNTETPLVGGPSCETPSPERPSEIESVGYENLFDKDVFVYELGYYDDTGSILSSTATARTLMKIPVQANTEYIISGFSIMTYQKQGTVSRIYFFDENKNFISRTSLITDYNERIFKTPENCKYIDFQITIKTDGDTVDKKFQDDIDKFQLEKGKIAHSPIRFGKYGIEVETTGKNFLNVPSVWGFERYTQKPIFIPAGTYYISMANVTKGGTSNPVLVLNDTAIYLTSNKSQKVTFDVDITKYSYYSNGYSWAGSEGITSTVENLMISVDGGAYQPYHEPKTLLIILDEPLRSMPSKIKDIAYIENNKLYVDRKTGSLVLNGSESWTVYGERTHTFSILLGQTIGKHGKGYSTHFKSIVASKLDVENGIYDTYTNRLIISHLGSSSVDEFKNWLSTNNVQVDYELETPVTEELGEIEMLRTLQGANNISANDNVGAMLHLEYVRDTILTDYVENHVAEIKITENEIKESVQTVSTSVNGLQSTINRVEETTNDNSKVINVITTNIDQTTGEVREVTTTTGFTFNKDGMTIADGSGFSAQHRAEGTYYKDGTSTVGQYTKDGSKQKDLELFGIYSYGKEKIEDTPMFIAQLYTDENGEECFGHFINI